MSSSMDQHNNSGGSQQMEDDEDVFGSILSWEDEDGDNGLSSSLGDLPNLHSQSVSRNSNGNDSSPPNYISNFGNSLGDMSQLNGLSNTLNQVLNNSGVQQGQQQQPPQIQLDLSQFINQTGQQQIQISNQQQAPANSNQTGFNPAAATAALFFQGQQHNATVQQPNTTIQSSMQNPQQQNNTGQGNIFYTTSDATNSSSNNMTQNNNNNNNYSGTNLLTSMQQPRLDSSNSNTVSSPAPPPQLPPQLQQLIAQQQQSSAQTPEQLWAMFQQHIANQQAQQQQVQQQQQAQQQQLNLQQQQHQQVQQQPMDKASPRSSQQPQSIPMQIQPQSLPPWLLAQLHQQAQAQQPNQVSNQNQQSQGSNQHQQQNQGSNQNQQNQGSNQNQQNQVSNQFQNQQNQVSNQHQQQNQGSNQNQQNQGANQNQQNQGANQIQNQQQMQNDANNINISVNSSADINAYLQLRQRQQQLPPLQQQQQPPPQQVYRPESAQDSSSRPASSQLASQSKSSSAAAHRGRMRFKTLIPDLSQIQDSPKEAASATTKAQATRYLMDDPPPKRTKTTSLAQQAKIAMRAAQECAAMEHRGVGGVEMPPPSQVPPAAQPNPSRSNPPIVSHDELSDASSFRKRTQGSSSSATGKKTGLDSPNTKPISSPQVPNTFSQPLSSTSDPTALLASTNMTTTTKTLLSGLKTNNVTGLLDHEDAFKKTGYRSSATTGSHDYVSASETDGGMTTDAETHVSSRRHKKTSAATSAPSHTSIAPSINMSELSEEERTRLNRDRNREHARNTRLRKKAYLEKLKLTVDDLCRERDALVQERSTSTARLMEQHKLRVELVIAYFCLRQNGERRRDVWAGLCEENVVCTLPVTPYRSFAASEVQSSKCQRTVFGIDALIADSCSFHVMLDGLVDYNKVFEPSSSNPHYAVHTVNSLLQNGQSSPLWITASPPRIQIQFTLITEDAVSSGSQLMARWTVNTVNAVSLGASCEVSKSGMLYCKFNSRNKIVSMEYMFDVMAFMLQLKSSQAGILSKRPKNQEPEEDVQSQNNNSSNNTFKIIPNTVQTAQRYYDVPMILTLAERPYTILQVNTHWETMTGHDADTVVGKCNASILQTSSQKSSLTTNTSDPNLSYLMMEVRFKRPATTTLINVNAKGEPFRQVLQVFPLCTDGKVTHYLGLTIFYQALTNIPTPPIAATSTVISESVTSSAQSISTNQQPTPKPQNNSTKISLPTKGITLPLSFVVSQQQQPPKQRWAGAGGTNHKQT